MHEKERSSEITEIVGARVVRHQPKLTIAKYPTDQILSLSLSLCDVQNSTLAPGVAYADL